MNKHFVIETPKDDPSSRKFFLLVALVDQAYSKIDLQINRIETAKESNDLKSLFADIHFFLVSVSNLRKILKELHTLLEDTQFKSIYEKYISDLDFLYDFRNHLEHIVEGRLDGKDRKGQSLKQPGMLGNLFNDDYNFGGESFNLTKTFQLLAKLLQELKEWNSKAGIYILWDMNISQY